MKTIGLIGGISYVSTLEYYRLLNEGINRQLGGLNFASCAIWSFNYAEIKRNNDANNWDATFELLQEACLKLQQGGVSAILLCANTMHLLAERLQAVLEVPLIHIATETARCIREQGLQKVALLGTRFTMELDFFGNKLEGQGLEVLIPGEEDRIFIQHTIYEELGRGLLLPETRERYLRVIDDLRRQGAQGVILGCTEIPLLLRPEDLDLPAFDTTQIHVHAAVRFSLGQ